MFYGLLNNIKFEKLDSYVNWVILISVSSCSPFVLDRSEEVHSSWEFVFKMLSDKVFHSTS